MKRFLKKAFAVCLALVLVCTCAPVALAGRPYAAKDVVQFGSYPQAEVTDETLLAELAAAEKEWHSYEYYSGNKELNSMKPSDFMKYADFEYAGVRYRAVQGYRPDSSLQKADVLSEEKMEKSTAYFAYAPLEWIVVDPDSGWLISKEIVDAQPFCNAIYGSASSIFSTDPTGVYNNDVGENASNYGTSSLRAWLNETFWDLAFTEPEQNFVADTAFTDTDSKSEVQATLSDKVFLCSMEDVEGETLPAAAKLSAVNCTPYAIRQGAVNYRYVTHDTDPVYESGSTWWLRTGNGGRHNSALLVQGYTGTLMSKSVWFVRCVRPSIRLTNIDQALHDHSFTSSVTKDPTCTEDGERTFLCSGCGYSYTETISATGHTTEHKTVAATCTVNGAEFDECAVCGAKFNEQTIIAAGHQYDDAVTKDPTCTEKGTKTFTCTVCGDSYAEDIDATGHTTEHKTVAATCTVNGAEFDECTVCGIKLNEQVIAAAGHQYDTAVTKAATCTEKGTKTFTCSLCGDSYTEDIAQLPHNLTTVSIPATCTQSGIRYEICSLCGKRFNETETTARGHAYDAQITRNATCTQPGEKTYICSVCGNTYTEQTATVPHTLSPVLIPATCTADGAQFDQCSICGGKFNRHILPAFGHHYVDGVCTECGDVEYWDLTQENGEITLTGLKGTGTELYIPARINGLPVTAIDEAAFSGVETVEFVYIPDSVRVIGANAFRGCPDLREVFLGSGVQHVRSGAFADCPQLALTCVSSANCSFVRDAFSGCDSRMCCIVPAETDSASVSSVCGVRSCAYSLRKRGDKDVLAFSGKTVLYGDLDYHYWVELAHRMPDVWYFYFDSLTIDGISPSFAEDFDPNHLDPDAESLTLTDIYMSIQLGGEDVTFERLIELLEQGEIGVVLTFDTDNGGKLTFWQKIGGYVHKVYGALTKLINAIIRIFRRK